MGWGGASVRERNGDGGYGYGCGASGSKAEENSAGQEAGCQTRALNISNYLGIVLRQRRQPLSAAFLSLRPTRPCRCIHTPHPHSTHPLHINVSSPLK